MRLAQKIKQHACQLNEKSVVDNHVEQQQSRWPQLKKWLLNFYTVNPNLPWTDEYLKSQAEIQEEQKKHLTDFPWTIHPLSSLSLCWNTFMILVYIVLFCEITLRYFELLQNKPLTTVGIIIVFILSLTNFLDVLVHIFRGRISNEGNLLHVELSMKKNFKKYLRGFFLIDIIATVPYLIAFYGHIYHLENAMWLNRVAHHLTVFRIARLNTFCRYIVQFLRFCGVGDNTSDISVLIVLALIMFHSLVTLQLIPTISHVDIMGTPHNASWVYTVGLHEKTSYEQYVICFYRGVQLLMGGGITQTIAATVTIDRIVSTMIIIFGCFVRCIFLAKILEVLLRTRSHKIKHEEMMNQLSHYLSVKKFSSETKKKFKRFFEEKQDGSYFREDLIMDCLPDTLRNEVLSHNMRILLERVAFLRELPSTQFEWLIQRLQQEILLPDTVLFKFGAKGTYICFVSSGTLAMYSPSNVEIGYLFDGDVIGLQALVMQEETHLITVRSLETCEIYKLSKDDFNQLIEQNPTLLRAIETLAMEQYELVRAAEQTFERRQSYNFDVPKDEQSSFDWLTSL